MCPAGIMNASQPNQGVRLIVQARTDSRRLPGKALEDVAGLPAAVFAALRAGNTGMAVVLATSDRAVDDALAAAATAHGVAVFRGAAEDVLGRFVGATADMADDAIVVRLTADNLLPDGAFIATLIAEFAAADGIDYLATSSPRDGLPYGLSAEVMTAGVLRRAGQVATTDHDREHVTPWIGRTARCAITGAFRALGLDPGLRVTIDDPHDLAFVRRGFAGVADPVHLPWRDLLARLAADGANRTALPGRPVPVMGTAQLAAPYGSAHPVSPPDAQTARALITAAVLAGLVSFDTAVAYGGAQATLGAILQDSGLVHRARVVTKLPPGVTAADVPAGVATACDQLGLVPDMLLHRADDFTAPGVWGALAAEQKAGRVGRIGVSVQSPAELLAVLKNPDVALVQFPLNLLDHRWRAPAVQQALADRQDVEVHVRSVYLQGVLIDPARRGARISGFDAPAIGAMVGDLAGRTRRESPADLCLAYVRAMACVDGVVLGMESRDQLAANLRAFATPALTDQQVALVDETLPRLPETVLNPALWRLEEQT